MNTLASRIAAAAELRIRRDFFGLALIAIGQNEWGPTYTILQRLDSKEFQFRGFDA